MNAKKSMVEQNTLEKELYLRAQRGKEGAISVIGSEDSPVPKLASGTLRLEVVKLRIFLNLGNEKVILTEENFRGRLLVDDRGGVYSTVRMVLRLEDEKVFSTDTHLFTGRVLVMAYKSTGEIARFAYSALMKNDIPEPRSAVFWGSPSEVLLYFDLVEDMLSDAQNGAPLIGDRRIV